MERWNPACLVTMHFPPCAHAGMHANAELSLLTSQGETLFKTVIEVGGGSSGGGDASGGEGAIRSTLQM
eukprot:1158640-Pelagomonas_calceolata.AAC.2